MANLSQLLNAPRRDAVVAELSSFIDTTVSEQSGITGMAIKGTVAAARKVDSNVVSKSVAKMLPDLLGELEPHWQQFEASGSTDFGEFLAPRAHEISQEFLATADQHAQKITVPAVLKGYKALHSKGAKIIEAKVPEMGRILQGHMT